MLPLKLKVVEISEYKMASIKAEKVQKFIYITFTFSWGYLLEDMCNTVENEFEYIPSMH